MFPSFVNVRYVCRGEINIDEFETCATRIDQITCRSGYLRDTLVVAAAASQLRACVLMWSLVRGNPKRAARTARCSPRNQCRRYRRDPNLRRDTLPRIRRDQNAG